MAQVSSLRVDEVHQAIESLLAEGIVPTQQAVRERVGGRGSPPVISRHIAQWYAEHGQDFAAKVDVTRKNKPASSLAQEMMETAGKAAKLVSDAERERQEVLDQRAAQLHEAEQALAGRELALLQQQEKLADRELEQAHLVAELRNDKAGLQVQVQHLADTLEAARHAMSKADAVAHSQAKDAQQAAAAAAQQLAEASAHVEHLRARLTEIAGERDAARDAESRALAALQQRDEAEREAQMRANDLLARANEANAQCRQEFLQQLADQARLSAELEQRLRTELQHAADVSAAALHRSVLLQGELQTARALLEDRADFVARHVELVEMLRGLSAKITQPQTEGGEDQ
ncbi:DNA-binding protein [Xanthomonas hortorum]|uniref:DNA-binding protein n=1 Tax=Xanthomonas hortorum TaxID=56454 RepID=UPI0032E8F3A4